MNVGANAEQPHLMRRLSRGLGNSKLGTTQEDNDDDNDEDDVNNPMALMRKVLSGHARSMIAIQSDSVMMEEGRRRRRRRGDCVDPEADVVNDPRRRSPGYQSP